MVSNNSVRRYRERSPRLTGYDYSSEGAYFITICTLQREHFFGRIESGRMIKTISGESAEKYWREIPEHYPFVQIDEYVIMPNHIHGILIINKILCGDIVGTPNLGVPTGNLPTDGNIDGSPNLGVPTGNIPTDGNIDGTPRLGVPTAKPIGGKNIFWKPNSIGSVINQYKRICTITIRSMGIDFSWQPRFYDRVIRSNSELIQVRNYIRENPLKWNSGKKCNRQ
jgi:REP element-mobilizing transposase RayT